MKNYSEDADRQYHIQVAKGEVGRYVILTLFPIDPCNAVLSCITIRRSFIRYHDLLTMLAAISLDPITI